MEDKEKCIDMDAWALAEGIEEVIEVGVGGGVRNAEPLLAALVVAESDGAANSERTAVGDGDPEAAADPVIIVVRVAVASGLWLPVALLLSVA